MTIERRIFHVRGKVPMAVDLRMSREADVASSVRVDMLMPARHSDPNLMAGNVPSANYNVISENLRRVTPNGIQCSFFCGGRRCKYETPDHWDSAHMAIDGIFSH
ncbi:Protein tyrosine phosphatase domain-containing protein 1, partial [Gryllus bimaculatus]